MYNKSIPKSQCHQRFMEAMTQQESTVDKGKILYYLLEKLICKNQHEHFHMRRTNPNIVMYACNPGHV